MKNLSQKIYTLCGLTLVVILLSSCSLSRNQNTQKDIWGATPSNAEVNISPPTPINAATGGVNRPIPSNR